MSFPRVRAVLWDVDGVLLHSYDADGSFYWARDLEKDLGVSAAVHRDIFAERWPEVLRGQRDTQAHVAEIFAHHNVATPVERYIDYWLAKDRRVNEAASRYLSPARSYLATNQDRLRTRVLADMFGAHVGGIFASSAFGALKPEAAYYAHIEKTLNLSGAALALIDDNADNIAAAAQRGWRAHRYNPHAGDADALLANFLTDV